ncbi:MAG: hypothetical protein NXH74_10090 [Rhodobacteraceae bacterium]|nr:hypothetical protein [Paracoccaceae bacterium]
MTDFLGKIGPENWNFPAVAGIAARRATAVFLQENGLEFCKIPCTTC